MKSCGSDRAGCSRIGRGETEKEREKVEREGYVRGEDRDKGRGAKGMLKGTEDAGKV